MEKPNYYGILPSNVRYDKRLKPMEKIMYVEITALSNKNGYCNATNSYFAELYEVGKNTVSLWINNLEKAGYIKTKIIYEAGTKNIKERRIYLDTPITKNNDTYHEKEVEPIMKNNDTPITKNREDNNTSINNTSINNTSINNNKEKNIKKEKPKIETIKNHIDTLDIDEERKEIFKEWVDYKSERKEYYASTKSITILIKSLSIHSTEYLRKIVEHTIMRNWRGITEPEEWKKKREEQERKEKTERPVIKNNYDLEIDKLSKGDEWKQ